MATTIRIDDTAHPLYTARSNDDVSSKVGIDDGIHNMRDFTNTATSSSGVERDGIYNMRAITRTTSRSSSKGRQGLKGVEKDAEDDDPGLRRSGDFKAKQVCGLSLEE